MMMKFQFAWGSLNWVCVKEVTLEISEFSGTLQMEVNIKHMKLQMKPLTNYLSWVRGYYWTLMEDTQLHIIEFDVKFSNDIEQYLKPVSKT